MITFLLLIINVLMLVGGQVLWKLAVSPITAWSLEAIMQLVISPLFLGGTFLYVVATVLWLIILSKMPLSIAYPFQSFSYILGAIAAYFVFQESISLEQVSGMAAIVLGVYLIAK
ncbi:EamA family transporter [Jeotgalibacillus aurantiacus]|uniref:EamA family transporter n=1 Tax=Jeotgalibacillus aurantiacus TaxID=2763266 RepID=UPI001D0A6EA4|nr:EamA family transporter [Jeotgalibacillus aurantiacus]